MSPGPTVRKVPVLLALGILLSGAVALTASNSIPTSQIGETFLAQSANNVKPVDCTSLTLTGVVSGTLIVNGTDANELVLGSVGLDTLDGKGGDDCIMGGALADTLIGGAGNDVCIGGGGTDVLDLSCEVQIQ